MDTPTQTLADIVSTLREQIKATGLSAVANSTSIGKATLSHITNGVGFPTVQNIDRLAAHFGYGFKLHSTDRRKRHATAVTQKARTRSAKRTPRRRVTKA